MQQPSREDGSEGGCRHRKSSRTGEERCGALLHGHEATSKETVDAGKDENGSLSNRWIPGPVRHMKVVKDEAAHRQIYEKVRAISLFVMKLPMYLICESLADVSPELGCTKALAPSWSEIQSVWLRMGSRGTWRFCGQALRGVLRRY